jgi:hypothetical protein
VSTDDAAPQIVPLDRPRPLSGSERALLDRLLTHPLATAELREQAEGAMVTAVCICGCPSVTLSVPNEAPVAQLDANHPNVRHGEDADISAEGRSPDARELDVVLHILGGRLGELEVWAGTFGGDPRTDLPEASTLEFW